MFACCDDFGKGDQYLTYDCKTHLPGGGTCNDEADCKANYQRGLEVIEAEKLRVKPEEEEDKLMQWVIASVILIVGGSILIALTIIFYRTKCCQQCRAKKEDETVTKESGISVSHNTGKKKQEFTMTEHVSVKTNSLDLTNPSPIRGAGQ